jgi:hypothetical protein
VWKVAFKPSTFLIAAGMQKVKGVEGVEGLKKSLKKFFRSRRENFEILSVKISKYFFLAQTFHTFHKLH